jgi:DNA-binding SARP family transcriptional activator
VEFKVLGTIEVRADDLAAIELRQPRQRNLLAVLLLRANQRHSTHELIEAMWEPRAGDTTRLGALRTQVWSLRRALSATDRLVRDREGYRLRVKPGELDLDEFRDLADKGRKAVSRRDFSNASFLLGRAVSLWHDPRLPDLPQTTAMELASRRLRAERDMISELLTDVRMALGQHRDLVPDLEAEVTSQPVNEYRWAQFILALYRSGQQIRALHAYSHVRAMLTNEYGVDPGPALLRLHTKILRADPTLEHPEFSLVLHSLASADGMSHGRFGS